MKIGVLALQGAVREHIRLLEQYRVMGVPVKYAHELEDLDGLILPGGESTTISKMMNTYQLMEPIRQFHRQGKPIFGTCAGLILIAKELDDRSATHLGILDVCVKRNAFGRQRDSFEAYIDIQEVGKSFPCVFIRAPYISRVGASVTILAEYAQDIVAVRQASLLGASFHPELTEDPRFHAYFVQMVEESMVGRGNN